VQAHILDPRRGEPVRRPVGGVTVFAPDGALADGLATALFVLGPEEGLPWLARAYPRAQAFFLTQTPDGGWAERASPGWESMFTRFPASGTGESQNRESH